MQEIDLKVVEAKVSFKVKVNFDGQVMTRGPLGYFEVNF